MSQRQSEILWLRDLLQHMKACQQQLEWAQDGKTIGLLTDNMLRDLEHCRRLCDGLRRRAAAVNVA